MTRPPCVRLCPAHPGNPRTRIEGESPPLRKGTYGLRSRAFARRLEGWATGTYLIILRDAAKTPLLRMRSILHPLDQLSDQGRDPPCRRRHFVHDGEMIGAGNLFIRHRQSVSGAVGGEIRGLLA